MKDISILKENGIDVDKSLELFGDIETYNETLESFLEEIDDMLSKLKQYKEIADTANYAIIVHSLKSDAKYFGFTKLAELSYNHEMESKANNIYYVYDHFEELMNEVRRILNVLGKYLDRTIIKEEITEDVIKNQSILVVDDSDVISKFVKKIFNDKYNVIIAHDGMEAINSLGDDKIVAMLLDLNMPNVNGFVVLEYLKLNNLFDKFPVSIITGVGDDKIIDKAFEYPIKDVLRKPFNERDIKNVLDKMIN